MKIASSEGEQLLSCSDDGSSRLWSRTSRQCLHTLSGHYDDVHSAAHIVPPSTVFLPFFIIFIFAVSSQNNKIFTGGKDRVVKVFSKNETKRKHGESKVEWKQTSELALNAMIRAVVVPHLP